MALYPITNVPLRSAVCTIIAKGQTHHNPRLYPMGTKKALDSQESLSLTRDKSHGGFVLEKHQLDRLAEVANPCPCISLRHRRRRTSERGRERESAESRITNRQNLATAFAFTAQSVQISISLA